LKRNSKYIENVFILKKQCYNIYTYTN